MTAMPTMRNIANATPANATDVDWNFETIETHVGNQLINRDGSVSMSAELLLAGNPSSSLGAAPKQYVDGLLPAGMIAPFAGSAAPTGWLLADGSVVSQTTYAALYAACGTAYNTGGEGAGNFRLPNLKTRMPVGRDSGTAPFQTLGGTGGSKDATVPTHSHTIDHGHTASSGGASANHTHTIDHNHANATSTAAGAHSHGMQAGYYILQQQSGAGAAGGVTIAANQAPASGQFQWSDAANHTHDLDLPNFTGSSGANSADHTHAVTVNSLTGSSGTTGSALTNLNLPPYLTVNYIIKT